jgi:hypothetical protein
MGKRRRHAKQATMWVATQDLPRTAGRPFYARLNQILDKHDFDGYVEELCQRFYADEVGRPGLRCGFAASISNGPSPISTKPVGCAACTCAGT